MTYHSLICQGSSKEAHTCWASSWWLSMPGILASSGHQPGVLCAPCLPGHSPFIISTGASGEDLFLSSSSTLLVGSWRKWSTSGPNSRGGPRLKSRRGSLASSSSPDPGPHWGGAVLQRRVQDSPLAKPCSTSLQCHPQDLLLWQSPLQEGAWMSG